MEEKNNCGVVAAEEVAAVRCRLEEGALAT